MQFNQAQAEAVSCGAPYNTIALPGIGTVIPLDEIQWMALDAYHKGAATHDAMVGGVQARLQAQNKSLLKDGNPPTGAALARELAARLEPFAETVLPLLRRLGGVR